jgi:hypothetical protein
MRSRRSNAIVDDGPTLKDIDLPTIEVVCVRCQHRDVLERKAIVRKLGVNVSFTRLRRLLAMGCDRFFHLEGDRCGLRFPCLDNAEKLKQSKGNTL